ncbi:molybdenum cofactor guanylyltransferase [Permianibacter aggregans]|nr:molybdenum cofactor guanylyltransferase [Permianibacter aggregans]
MMRIGVVLAGGKSSRMRRDKALLDFHGQPLLQHAQQIVQRCCDEVWVSGRDGGLRSVPDRFVDRGPVGALHAVCAHLLALKTKASVLFVPVDMPLLRINTLQKLFAVNAPAVHFAERPLPAVINDLPTIVEHAEVLLRDPSASVSVRELWRLVGAHAMDLSTELRDQFVNANTPEQWQQMLQQSLLSEES